MAWRLLCVSLAIGPLGPADRPLKRTVRHRLDRPNNHTDRLSAWAGHLLGRRCCDEARHVGRGRVGPNLGLDVQADVEWGVKGSDMEKTPTATQPAASLRLPKLEALGEKSAP